MNELQRKIDARILDNQQQSHNVTQPENSVLSIQRQNESTNVTQIPKSSHPVEQPQNVTLLDTNSGDFGQPVLNLSNQQTADNLQHQQNSQQQGANPISSTLLTGALNGMPQTNQNWARNDPLMRNQIITPQISQSSPIVSANFVSLSQMSPQYQHPNSGLHPTTNSSSQIALARETTPQFTNAAYQHNTNVVGTNLHQSLPSIQVAGNMPSVHQNPGVMTANICNVPATTAQCCTNNLNAQAQNFVPQNTVTGYQEHNTIPNLHNFQNLTSLRNNQIQSQVGANLYALTSGEHNYQPQAQGGRLNIQDMFECFLKFMIMNYQNAGHSHEPFNQQTNLSWNPTMPQALPTVGPTTGQFGYQYQRQTAGPRFPYQTSVPSNPGYSNTSHMYNAPIRSPRYRVDVKRISHISSTLENRK